VSTYFGKAGSLGMLKRNLGSARFTDEGQAAIRQRTTALRASMPFSLDIGPELSNIGEGIMDKIAPKTKQAMTRAIQELLEHARGGWPIGDGLPEGHSIERFETSVTLRPDGIYGMLANRASYAAQVHAGETRKRVRRRLASGVMATVSRRIRGQSLWIGLMAQPAEGLAVDVGHAALEEAIR